jgi:hypothetical protein
VTEQVLSLRLPAAAAGRGGGGGGGGGGQGLSERLAGLLSEDDGAV